MPQESRPSGTPSSGFSSWSVDSARVHSALINGAHALGEATMWLHQVARSMGHTTAAEDWRERARHLAVAERALRDVAADYATATRLPLPRAEP